MIFERPKFEQSPEIKSKAIEKEEEIEGRNVFSNEEIERFKEINNKIDLFEADKKLSEEQMEEWLKLEREKITLNIARQKKINKLIGPHLPLALEAVCAKYSGKTDELAEKYYEEKKNFQEKEWNKLSAKEQDTRGEQAINLTLLEASSMAKFKPEVKRPPKFIERLEAVRRERDQEEAEEL